ncbi:hypothetical protein CE91St17_20900 [Alistipes onderdonkii]|nr:hypothetical protein CE91St18_25460 [Alistipes onderdonkii]GKG97028.1 hypothetical protein CE91St17_20900 [Alistipes onderdonkii]
MRAEVRETDADGKTEVGMLAEAQRGVRATAQRGVRATAQRADTDGGTEAGIVAGA